MTSAITLLGYMGRTGKPGEASFALKFSLKLCLTPDIETRTDLIKLHSNVSNSLRNHWRHISQFLPNVRIAP